MPRPESTDMATNSKTRPRVRPIPIAEFCEKILAEFKATARKKHYTTNGYARVVTNFLSEKPSVKTTADLTSALIPEFRSSIEHYKGQTNRGILYVFKKICCLAVDWRCLKQSPFDGYEMPKNPTRSRATLPRGRKLGDDQVEKLLAYLKARTDTWNGHRLYIITRLIINTGLKANEALELTTDHCDLDMGLIRVPRRVRYSWPKDDPIVQIGPDMVEDLKAWLPHRKEGKRAKPTVAHFGTRLAEDGHTVIPDEAEQRAKSDMIRWRSEGWSCVRIARELDSQGVPTKTGLANWNPASIVVILKREGRYHANVVDGGNAASDDPDQGENAPGIDLAWIFPNISGKGRWANTGDPGYTPLDQVREAGKAVGIEGLTLESLRRYFRENARIVLPSRATAWPLLDLPIPAGSNAPPIETISTTRESSTNKDISINQCDTASEVSPPAPVSRPRPPILWRGTQEQLDQEIAAIESKPCQESFRTLLAATLKNPPERLNKAQLHEKSRVGDAYNHLRELDDSGSRLGKAIDFAGRGRSNGIGLMIDII